MKATGIIRRIDYLGRIVIPKEICRQLHIKENDPFEIYINEDKSIALKPYIPMEERAKKILFQRR